MENENASNIGERIKALRLRLGINQEDLGKKLGGLATSTISGYESGDSQPRAVTLSNIARLAGVSLDWLITGQEAAEENVHGGAMGKKGEIAATIEPGKRDSRDRQIYHQRKSTLDAQMVQDKPASMPAEDIIDESFSMSEMVTMTIEVLESKTVYRSALASNVRAFHQAVKMEGEMKGVKEEVQKMRAEHRTGL